jgi:Uma2 family endonuclease
MIKTLQKRAKKPQNAQKPRMALNGFLQVHRFTVDEYHDMIDAGIFAKNNRVEFLNGWVVDKMPQNPPHRTSVTRLDRWLGKLLSEVDWTVLVQGPVTLAKSEPEPDIAIARGPDTLFELRHPGPLDIAQIIEVSDSSLLYDREEKGPTYAAAGIPHYWIVNLVDGCVECYSRPQAGRRPAYRTVKTFTKNDLLLLVLDGKKYGELAVSQLMS